MKCRMLYRRCASFFSSLWRRVSHIASYRVISRVLRSFGLCFVAVLALTFSPLCSSSASAYTFPAGWSTHPLGAKLSSANYATNTVSNSGSGTMNVSSSYPYVYFAPWGGKIEQGSIISLQFQIYDGIEEYSRISFNNPDVSPLVPLGIEIDTSQSQYIYTVYYFVSSAITSFTYTSLSHNLVIWLGSGSQLKLIGGSNYTRYNPTTNVNINTSVIESWLASLDKRSLDHTNQLDDIIALMEGDKEVLNDILASSQAQTDAINEQTQQQQDQYDQEKEEESQREDEMDGQASQAEGIFTFDLTNPFSGLFGLFTNSNCVSIPTLAGLVGSNETTYCSWFSPSVRSILTPAIGIVSTMIIFGFIVRWLSGSNTIEIGGK